MVCLAQGQHAGGGRDAAYGYGQGAGQGYGAGYGASQGAYSGAYNQYGPNAQSAGFGKLG